MVGKLAQIYYAKGLHFSLAINYFQYTVTHYIGAGVYTKNYLFQLS
jgi:hypothetical protein